MNHGFILGETEYEVGLSRARDGYRLHIDGGTVAMDLRPGEAGDWVLTTGDASERMAIAVDGDDIHIHLDGTTYHLRYEHPLQRLAELREAERRAAEAGDSIRAAMPGSLIALEVETGQHVAAGETLLVMESMKMETTLTAPRAGIVEAIHVDAGETFDKDAVLLTLEPEE